MDGFDDAGKDLGRIASCLERTIKIPGSGMFFLKLVDSGISVEEAKRYAASEKVPEMMNFADRYGHNWYQVLRGNYRKI